MAKKKTLADLVKEIRAFIPASCSLIIDQDRVLTMGAGGPAVEDIDLGPPAEDEPAAEEPGAEEPEEETWQPGEKCQVELDGSLYPGEVKEINNDDATCFVVFEDGDEGWYPAADLETLEATEDGGDAVDKGDFGLEALGLPKKTQEKLEAQGYATVKEIEEAVADGTLSELKEIPAAALKQVEKALANFTGK